jgi:hypothetical protein
MDICCLFDRASDSATTRKWVFVFTWQVVFEDGVNSLDTLREYAEGMHADFKSEMACSLPQVAYVSAHCPLVQSEVCSRSIENSLSWNTLIVGSGDETYPGPRTML